MYYLSTIKIVYYLSTILIVYYKALKSYIDSWSRWL